MALFALVARDLLRLTESVARAGALLADLAVDARYAAPGFRYFSNQLVRPGLHRFGAAETSAAGADPAQATVLWQLSEALIAEPAASRPAVAWSGRLGSACCGINQSHSAEAPGRGSGRALQ